MRLPIASAVLVAVLSACTWVKMEPGAREVRVARMGDDLAACEKRGEIAVSVRDKVALYQRNDLKVRDELETLARNEADGLSADTVQPVNDPSGGEQRFAAYTCGRYAPVASRGAAPTAASAQAPRELREAETFPVRDE